MHQFSSGLSRQTMICPVIIPGRLPLSLSVKGDHCGATEDGDRMQNASHPYLSLLYRLLEKGNLRVRSYTSYMQRSSLTQCDTRRMPQAAWAGSGLSQHLFCGILKSLNKGYFNDLRVR